MAHDDPADTAERLTNLAHLSSAVGHHVINAYSAIVSNAEILRLTARSGTPADPIAVADLVIRTAVEASGVARRLIDYTRPVTQIGESNVSLSRLIAEVVESRKGSSRSRVTWTAHPGDVPAIRGHVDQLRAMIGHILQNSEEAMSTSGGAISLSTSVDGRGWIALEIADTGPGMTPEIHERAVEPFFTTKIGHMGVGLSIANGIWRRHRGTLALKSRPGDGTLVRLCVDPNETTTIGLR
jgi:two-component system NtrC family sensor kinase